MIQVSYWGAVERLFKICTDVKFNMYKRSEAKSEANEL